MTTKRTIKRIGPISGVELEHHVNEKVSVGSIINVPPEGWIEQRPIEFGESTMQDAEGHYLLLEYLATGHWLGCPVWKVLHIKSRRVAHIDDRVLRIVTQRKVRQNWLNRYKKGKAKRVG